MPWQKQSYELVVAINLSGTQFLRENYTFSARKTNVLLPLSQLNIINESLVSRTRVGSSRKLRIIPWNAVIGIITVRYVFSRTFTRTVERSTVRMYVRHGSSLRAFWKGELVRLVYLDDNYPSHEPFPLVSTWHDRFSKLNRVIWLFNKLNWFSTGYNILTWQKQSHEFVRR